MPRWRRAGRLVLPWTHSRRDAGMAVRDGRAEAELIRAAERLVAPQDPTTMIDWSGSRRGRPGVRLAWRSSGDGFEESMWSSVRLVRPVREMTHHLTERGDRGGPASAMPVPGVEGEGEVRFVCESSGPTGYEPGVEVDMGALCVQRGSRGLHHVRAGQYVCVELVRARDLESWQQGDNC